MRRLTNLEVSAYRAKLVSKQGGRCVLCGNTITGKVRGGAVLDHDHKTGVIRAALCRVCNSGEGKVLQAAIRYSGGADQARGWLERIVKYYALHEEHQTQYLYPEKKKPKKRKVKSIVETT